jgi:2-dehydropantoate 2-reductase
MPLRHIVVYGVGGVGGVIGGRMARYLEARPESGAKVYFIARGEHLKKIRERGLILNSGDQQNLICQPTLASDTLEGLPPPDLVFICVKSYDLDGTSAALARTVADRSIIIPLLNGVDVYERMRKSFDRGIILPACIYIGTHIEEPGTVTHKGGEGRILLGRDPLHREASPDDVLRFLDTAAIPYRWFEDSFPAIWEKYIFIAPFGLVTAASGKTLGEVIEDRELKGLTAAIMEEIRAIAREKKIHLPDDIVALSLAKAGNFPRETKTSYQRDLEQTDKPNEGDLFGGTIIRLGREFGVPTPVAESLYSRITTGRTSP